MTAAKINRLRFLVNAVLFMIIFGLVLEIAGGVASGVYTILVAVFSLVVNFAFSRLADSRVEANPLYYLYRYVPLLIFIVLPIGYKIYSAWGDSGLGLSGWIILFTWVLSYIVPIFLLLYLRVQLTPETT